MLIGALATSTSCAAQMLLLLALVLSPALSLDNGAARQPPLGWQSWNGYGMDFNATLYREMAKAMRVCIPLLSALLSVSAPSRTYAPDGRRGHTACVTLPRRTGCLPRGTT